MSDLVAAARAGDHAAFSALVGPHLRTLRLHCYPNADAVEA
jgi:hypothetical protein